jgi:hypothetical protein
MWQVYEVTYNGIGFWGIGRSEDDIIALCCAPNAAERVAGALNREKTPKFLSETQSGQPSGAA